MKRQQHTTVCEKIFVTFYATVMIKATVSVCIILLSENMCYVWFNNKTGI